MPPREPVKTLLQCDFDGTITVADVSYMLLDAFADGDWKWLLKEYTEGRILVGEFNTRAFAMVKANRDELVAYMRGRVIIRPGLPELLAACRRKGFRFVITSNGLQFYIETILYDLDIKGIEVHAAEAIFPPDGLKVRYVGPEGDVLQDGFKDAYTRLFVSQGYRVIYVGDGYSDFKAAKLAHKVFATHSLFSYCQQAHLDCAKFNDLNDIAREIELL